MNQYDKEPELIEFTALCLVLDLRDYSLLKVLREMYSYEKMENNINDISTIIDCFNSNNDYDHLMCVDISGIIIDDKIEEWEVFTDE